MHSRGCRRMKRGGQGPRALTHAAVLPPESDAVALLRRVVQSDVDVRHVDELVVRPEVRRELREYGAAVDRDDVGVVFGVGGVGVERACGARQRVGGVADARVVDAARGARRSDRLAWDASIDRRDFDGRAHRRRRCVLAVAVAVAAAGRLQRRRVDRVRVVDDDGLGKPAANGALHAGGVLGEPGDGEAEVRPAVRHGAEAGEQLDAGAVDGRQPA